MSQPTQVQKLMLLPTEAQRRYQEVTEETRKYENLFDAQKIIIDDLAVSLPNFEETEKKIEETEEQIAMVNEQLGHAQSILLNEMLVENNQNNNDSDPGELLKVILSKFQQILTQICASSIKDKQIGVSIMTIIDLENQINTIVDDLAQKGMYPETEEEAQARIENVEKHGRKILDFLNAFLAASKAQAQEASPEEQNE